MSNTEEIKPRDLLQEAKEAGLLDSNVTINCNYCNAIFPKDYKCCPQCGKMRIYHLTYYP